MEVYSSKLSRGCPGESIDKAPVCRSGKHNSVPGQSMQAVPG